MHEARGRPRRYDLIVELLSSLRFRIGSTRSETIDADPAERAAHGRRQLVAMAKENIVHVHDGTISREIDVYRVPATNYVDPARWQARGRPDLQTPPARRWARRRAACARRIQALEHVVRDEDYDTGNRIQRAVKTGAKAEFLFGRNEGGGHRFHRAVDRVLTATDDELAALFVDQAS